MQKFTIFTIILSTLIIAIVAELVIQDYVQKLNSESLLQANTFGSSFVAPYNNAEESLEPENTALAELNKRLQEIATNNSSASEITEDTTSPETIEPAIPFSRIQTLLPALRIEGLELTSATYNQRLFQLIDTTPLDIPTVNYATLDTDSDTVASVYEFTFRTSVDAENGFDEIRLLANSFPNIDTNQTNQFGDRSYYINHLVKVGEVFLVVRQENLVTAFAYKKEYHDIFKTFFGVLF
jgi:hypothetical protein